MKGFPHSEISGSKVARHLPEAYRRHATSFIAFRSQGIHHTPLIYSPPKFLTPRQARGKPLTYRRKSPSCFRRLKPSKFGTELHRMYTSAPAPILR